MDSSKSELKARISGSLKTFGGVQALETKEKQARGILAGPGREFKAQKQGPIFSWTRRTRQRAGVWSMNHIRLEQAF